MIPEIVGEIDEVSARILERARRRQKEATQELERLCASLSPEGVVPYRTEDGDWYFVEEPERGRPAPEDANEVGVAASAKADGEAPED